MTGVLALVGGAEWQPPAAALDAWLLERSGSAVVTVLPTAAVRVPAMAVASAASHFASLGGQVEAADVHTRADAEDPAWRARLGSARFLYLAGGEPRHLVATLAGTPAWSGVLDALEAGATVAGSSAGAMALCDRMLVPGSAVTEPGLGAIADLVVLPHFPGWADRLVPAARAVGTGRMVGIDECTGLVIDGETCRVLGSGGVRLFDVGDGAARERWAADAPAEQAGCR